MSVLYPPHPDLPLAGMLKEVRQALESAEVQARISGMGEEQFLDFLHRTLKTLHGSTINPSYTRSIFYACTVDVAPGSRENWSQVLLGCRKLLSALNEDQPPHFWRLPGVVDSEP